MSKPLNAALQMAENTTKNRALRKGKWAGGKLPEWLWRPHPYSYGQKQVRSVKIYRDGTPYASIQFSHGIWLGTGARTLGELMRNVAEEIEWETGIAWRKGPR